MKFEIKNINQQRVIQQGQKGFTLVELLISMTITLVIVGLLMGMTKMAVGAWQTSHAKARSSRLAQEVFGSIGKDLEGIVIRSGNTYEWLLVQGSGNSSAQNGPAGTKEIVNPIEVSFFSAVTDRYNGVAGAGAGDISMVRYRLIHQDVIGAAGAAAKPVFALYRERIDPDATFASFLAQPSIDGAAVGHASASIVNAGNFLAENIFDFTLCFNFEHTLAGGVKGYKRVVVQAGGANNQLSISGNQILVNGDPLEDTGGAALISPRLVSADVSILVLSDSGMNSLATKNFTAAYTFPDFLKEHGHHYSKSVILPTP